MMNVVCMMIKMMQVMTVNFRLFIFIVGGFLFVQCEVWLIDFLRQLAKYCQMALDQIEEKSYVDELVYEGYTEVIKYGMAFNGKMCMVKLGVQL